MLASKRTRSTLTWSRRAGSAPAAVAMMTRSRSALSCLRVSGISTAIDMRLMLPLEGWTSWVSSLKAGCSLRFFLVTSLPPPGVEGIAG
ncbi:hypothetical protein D3C86_1689150 [compost metagenome]